MARKKVTNGRSGKPKAAKKDNRFPLDKPFELEQAQILDVRLRKKVDQETHLDVSIEALFSPTVAAVFGLKPLLFIDSNLAKEGWDRMRLSIGKLTQMWIRTCKNFTGEPLDVRATVIKGWNLKRRQGHLYVSLVLVFEGYSQQLTDFAGQVADARFGLRLEPLQGELFESPKPDQPQAANLRVVQ